MMLRIHRYLVKVKAVSKNIVLLINASFAISKIVDGVRRASEKIIREIRKETYNYKGCEPKNLHGCPQGSILGPLLWNVLYDDVLEISRPSGTELVAYADDLSIVIKADDEEDLMHKGNLTLRRLIKWMKKNKLELAPQQTEAIILKSPRSRDHIKFQILGESVMPTKKIKYPGVIFDIWLNFAKHRKYISEKADKKISALSKIMPNIGEPSPKKAGNNQLCGLLCDSVRYGKPHLEHTVRACARWTTEKMDVDQKVGRILNAGNLIVTMIENRENWKAVKIY
ncbi:hypothetical protein JTB14_008390 [Gonioctena quinquepunctata]|nr:hypothetical protein JTB14_008390 [Gonioctena quinquepunctata]